MSTKKELETVSPSPDEASRLQAECTRMAIESMDFRMRAEGAEEAIEVLIAERDGLKKYVEKAEAKLSSMAEYSIELQRLIEALSGGHPVPEATRAPVYRALAKCVKDERDALRKRVAELEAASMEADREISRALVWAGLWGNPALVVSQLKCSVSGATEAITERDGLKAKLAEAEDTRDVALENFETLFERAACLEKRAEKAEAFKAYVHKRLDEAGVPADPEPARNAETGCRIEGRLNFLLARANGAESSAQAKALAALRALANEAQAHVSLSTQETHGVTNIQCLRRRIAEARDALTGRGDFTGRAQ